jgi:hypothetical protein
VKAAARDLAEARTRVENFQNLRRQLDDDVFLLSQEQITSDKSAQNAQKAIAVSISLHIKGTIPGQGDHVAQPIINT